MKGKINRAVIQDVFVKLGLFFITGGIVGYVFDNKISAIAALSVMIIGIAFILVGAVRQPKTEE